MLLYVNKIMIFVIYELVKYLHWLIKIVNVDDILHDYTII